MKSTRWLAAVALAWTTLPAWAQTGGFGGPSILSRGSGPIGRTGGRPIRFRGYASVSGVYTTGLTSLEGEQIHNDESFGSMLGFGLHGSRTGRRSFGSVSYGGNYILYRENNRYNGVNHSLSLDYGHQLSPRWTFFLGQAASSQNRVFSEQPVPFSENPTAELPGVGGELFDRRIYMLSSAAGFTYRKSARLSFSMSGGAMMVERRARELADNRGFIARGSAFYLLNRRQGVGASYAYANYYFPGGFGQSDLMSWMGVYARTLSPRWSFSLGAGVYRVESERLQRVIVDPFIARITGQRSVLEVFHGINQGVGVDSTLSGRFRRSGVSFGYFRGITPGNGVILTGRQDRVFGHYSFTGTRRWNVGCYATWGRTVGLTQTAVSFESLGGGVGTGYRLSSYLHFTAGAQLLRSQTSSNLFTRDRASLSVGLAFSPGEVPLSLW